MVETASSTEEIVEGSAKLGVPKMKSPKGRHKIFKQTTTKKTKEPGSLKLKKWKIDKNAVMKTNSSGIIWRFIHLLHCGWSVLGVFKYLAWMLQKCTFYVVIDWCCSCSL